MSDTPSNTSGCSYTDGAQYVGCQVAEKGWPMPQSGGKRSKSKHCSKCGKSHCSKHSSMTRNRRRTRKGGFVQQAMVPFGLFALKKRREKRTYRKRSNKTHGSTKKSKKSRKFRR